MVRFARFLPFVACLGLAACATPDPLVDELPNMGDFRLSHNIVVADNMQQIPPSRNATSEEWVEILTSEIDRRFGAYEGDRLYHIGIAVDGYALAPPGIPIVLNPRSILVLSVNVWDDALGVKLHDEPEQIAVFESADAESTLVGSGLSRDREEQMQILARNAARQIQRWMLTNPEWFSVDPDAPPFREALDPDAAGADIVEQPETDVALDGLEGVAGVAPAPSPSTPGQRGGTVQTLVLPPAVE